MRSLIAISCLLLPVALHAYPNGSSEGLRPDFSIHRDAGIAALETFVRSGTLPSDPAQLIPALRVTGLIADIKNFNPGSFGDGASVFDRLLDSLRQRSEEETARWAAELEPYRGCFSAALLLGVLTPFSPDLTLILEPAAAEFSAMSRERQSQVIETLMKVWPDADLQIRQSTADSLRPFREVVQGAALQRAKALLALQTVNPATSDHLRWEDEIVEAAVDAAAVDLELAVRMIEHVAKLIEEAQQADAWHGRSYSGGMNTASGLLAKVCEGTERFSAFARHAVAARACNSPRQTAFICPSTDGSDLHRIFLHRRGLANPRDATKNLLSELQTALGDASPIALIFDFRAWTEKLSRWHRAIVWDEATRLATQPSPLSAIAAELAAGLGLLSQDEDALAHLRSRIADQNINPLLAAQCGALLMRTVEVPSGTDTALCVSAILPLLEHHWPCSNVIWESFLPAFNRCPDSVDWQQQTKRLCGAWLNRTRNQKLGNLPWWRRLDPSYKTVLHALETFCRYSDPEALAAFSNNHFSTYRSYASTRLILARHRCAAELQKVMTAFDGIAMNVDETEGVAFQERDAASFAWLEEVVTDPAQRLLARIQIAQVQDSNWQPASVRRHERLEREAKAFLSQASPMRPGMAEHAQDMLCSSWPAARTLAPSLLAAEPIESQWNKAFSSGSNVGQAVKRPLALAISALANGDDSAWRSSIDILKRFLAQTSDQTSLLRQLSYHTGILCMRHASEGGVESAPWFRQVLSDVIALHPKSPVHSELQEVLLMRLGYDCITNTPGSRLSVLPSGLSPMWLQYALNLNAYRDESAALQSLLRAMSHPAAQSILRESEDLSYQGKVSPVLSDQLLRAHTLEIIQADPGNAAALLTLLNAWTPVPDRHALLKAITAVKPKIRAMRRNARALDYIECVEREVAGSN